jgi:hypothetical protein
MLITPDFVFIHMPKTGGTFVTKMLQKVYGTEAKLHGRKHGTCEEIPEGEREKPIVSVFRSPFDRYISQFHYAWWKTNPQEYCEVDLLQKAYPSYPDLSFSDFVHVANQYFTNAHRGQANGYSNDYLDEQNQMGWHTEQFIRFFCRQPATAFASVRDENLHGGKIEAFEYPVEFMHTERLNQDLASLLSRFDISKENLKSVLEHDRILPKQSFEKRLEQGLEQYFDDALSGYLSRREQYLFNKFPQYQSACI